MINSIFSGFLARYKTNQIKADKEGQYKLRVAVHKLPDDLAFVSVRIANLTFLFTPAQALRLATSLTEQALEAEEHNRK